MNIPAIPSARALDLWPFHVAGLCPDHPTAGPCSGIEITILYAEGEYLDTQASFLFGAVARITYGGAQGERIARYLAEQPNQYLVPSTRRVADIRTPSEESPMNHQPWSVRLVTVWQAWDQTEAKRWYVCAARVPRIPMDSFAEAFGFIQKLREHPE